MNKDDILKVFKFRHACKEFNPDKKISDEEFNFILETARLSPSSFGIEPWEFLILPFLIMIEHYSTGPASKRILLWEIC